MKIVIIQHQNDHAGESGVYFIEMIARCWREAGHHVVFLNGVQENIRADLALLHVNLSVVPREYVEYAKQFPIVLNEKITDIRKRTISRQLVSRDEDYDGPVIVKTDLNCAGLPEANIYKMAVPKRRSVMRFWRFFVRKARNLAIKLQMVESGTNRLVQTEYRETFQIFKNKNRVPKYIWSDKNWIVEKFMPEMGNSKFVVRNAYFLGGKMIGYKNYSADPVVKDEEEAGSEVVSIPNEIVQFQNEIGLDYGKIDYVIHDGNPVILDVTKTMGGAFGVDAATILADGLEDYMLHKKKFV